MGAIALFLGVQMSIDDKPLTNTLKLTTHQTFVKEFPLLDPDVIDYVSSSVHSGLGWLLIRFK